MDKTFEASWTIRLPRMWTKYSMFRGQFICRKCGQNFRGSVDNPFAISVNKSFEVSWTIFRPSWTIIIPWSWIKLPRLCGQYFFRGRGQTFPGFVDNNFTAMVDKPFPSSWTKFFRGCGQNFPTSWTIILPRGWTNLLPFSVEYFYSLQYNFWPILRLCMRIT